MSPFEVRPYTEADAEMWNSFTAASKNATFLLDRRYMDYHSDRFTDASLIISRGTHTVALFAASISGGRVTAHGGLTYGGFILPFDGLDGAAVTEILGQVMDHYRRMGATSIIYKPIPYIYHRNPADEDLYALFRHGATLSACGLSSAIDLRHPRGYNENMRRNLRRSLREGVSVAPDSSKASLRTFWSILADVLAEHHSTVPVHTADELILLQSRFPEAIRLYTARAADGEMVAGALVFFTHRTAHVQYIAASARGRKLCALPSLFRFIADTQCDGLDYLDFGISTEQGGLTLNEGLHHQKYSLGGRGVTYPAYTITL